MGVVDSVPVVGVLVLSLTGKVFDLLYRLLGVHLPAFDLRDYGEHHLGQLFLAGMVSIL